MIAYRSRSRIAAWLALAGMALNAFWPLLANAKPSVPALPSEICSATGLQHTTENSPGEAPGKGARPSHCNLCPFNAERGAAISGAASVLVCSMPGSGQVHESFSEPQVHTALDPAARPRAPPYFS
jgi:hypothetical protein